MEAVEALTKVRDLVKSIEKANDVGKESKLSASLATEGVSLLQAKSATLLRYNLNLMKLALARIRGEPITEFAEVLVRDWVALTKMRSLEKKIQHHIDHLLSSAQANGNQFDLRSSAALTNLRPNPNAVVTNEDGESGDGENGENDEIQRETSLPGVDDDGAGTGVYRPPRLAEVMYGGDRDDYAERQQSERKKRNARAMRAESVRDLVAEVRGLPEEIVTDGTKAEMFLASGEMGRLARDERKRVEFEEDNFTRLAVSNRDKKRRKMLSGVVNSTQFGDGNDFQGLSSMADRVLAKHDRKGGPASGENKTKKKSKRHKRDEVSEDFKRQRLDEALQKM